MAPGSTGGASGPAPGPRNPSRQEIEAALRELGINLADWNSIEDFRRTVAFARDLREMEDFWAVFNHARERKRIDESLGNETRKGIIAAIFAALTAFVGGAVAAFTAMKGGTH